MRTVRFPIAGLIWAVTFAALGLAALRNASEVWAGATFLATCGVLCLAIVGVVCRTDESRAWWLGFALFGWGYLALAFWSPYALPTTALLHVLEAWMGATHQFEGGRRSAMLAGSFGGASDGWPDEHFAQIGHCLLALLAALLGGVSSTLLFGGRRARNENRVARPEAAAQARRRSWHSSAAILGLAAFVLVVVLGTFTARSSPGFWAGAAFFSTCGLLGIVIMGAATRQGKRRQICLGAAILGVGYMTLAFGRSADSNPLLGLPTDPLLASLRRWFPPIVSRDSTSSATVNSANARILEALERPLSMHFADETPLDDVMKFIHSATRGSGRDGIPIYVEPIGPPSAYKITPTVRGIDMEGVPLKTGLQLCLEQLDLKYEVRGGLLRITSTDSEMHPFYYDSFMIVGHCLLALLAAAFGAIVAPLVPGKHRQPVT
jgi:hypothetical protein